MADDELVDYLRVRFDRMEQAIAEVRHDVRGLKHRATTVELSLASLSRRLDHMDERMARIEHRFELVG